MSLKFAYHLQDLTHTLSSQVPSWNGSCGFTQKIVLDFAQQTSEVKFRVQKLSMHSGIGTHLDAPLHASQAGASIDELSLKDLVMPAIKIDVSASCNESQIISLEDIQAFVAAHGQIPDGAFVIIETGWNKFWGDRDRYRNGGRFPSVSKEAGQYLIELGAQALGIDTLSPDTEDSGYPIHQMFLGFGKVIVENLANLQSLPTSDFFVGLFPIKIEGGTEAPMRCVAFLKR